MRGISSFPISQDLLQEIRQLSTALPEVSQRLEGNEVRDRLKRISPNGRFLLLSDEEGELVSRYGAQVFRELGIHTIPTARLLCGLFADMMTGEPVMSIGDYLGDAAISTDHQEA